MGFFSLHVEVTKLDLHLPYGITAIKIVMIFPSEALCFSGATFLEAALVKAARWRSSLRKELRQQAADDTGYYQT